MSLERSVVGWERRGRYDLCPTELVGHNEGRAGHQVRRRSARKHRIGRVHAHAHALYVIQAAAHTRHPATDDLDTRIEWIGPDDRGVELEIIAVELPDL